MILTVSGFLSRQLRVAIQSSSSSIFYCGTVSYNLVLCVNDEGGGCNLAEVQLFLFIPSGGESQCKSTA